MSNFKPILEYYDITATAFSLFIGLVVSIFSAAEAIETVPGILTEYQEITDRSFDTDLYTYNPDTYGNWFGNIDTSKCPNILNNFPRTIDFNTLPTSPATITARELNSPNIITDIITSVYTSFGDVSTFVRTIIGDTRLVNVIVRVLHIIDESNGITSEIYAETSTLTNTVITAATNVPAITSSAASEVTNTILDAINSLADQLHSLQDELHSFQNDYYSSQDNFNSRLDEIRDNTTQTCSRRAFFFQLALYWFSIKYVYMLSRLDPNILRVIGDLYNNFFSRNFRAYLPDDMLTRAPWILRIIINLPGGLRILCILWLINVPIFWLLRHITRQGDMSLFILLIQIFAAHLYALISGCSPFYILP